MLALITAVLLTAIGCGNVGDMNALPVISEPSTQSVTTLPSTSPKQEEPDEGEMILTINDIVIPVTWSENTAVQELKEQAAMYDITVQLSRYSDFEQVGALGKSYTAQNEQITAENGDIVLYNSSNIVLLYGSNSWYYTKLGHMNLSEKEVREMLDQENVTVRISLKNHIDTK